MRDLFWARKELATLDPVRDARRYAQISLQPCHFATLPPSSLSQNKGQPNHARSTSCWTWTDRIC